jgi:hypothetical protein
MNFCMSSSGYYSSEYDVQILFVFNTGPNIIYYSNEISRSKDNEPIFLSSFKSDTANYKSRIDFIEKLKKASRLNVSLKVKFQSYYEIIEVRIPSIITDYR